VKSVLAKENIPSLTLGFANLKKHIETIQSFGLPVVVAVNKFITDTKQEVDTLLEWCQRENVAVALTEVWEKGGAGGIDLANKLLAVMDREENHFKPLYDLSDSIEKKVRTIVQKVYGGNEVELSSKAKKQLIDFEKFGWSNLAVCMAKSQYSLSDDPSKLGRPSDFNVTVREFKPSIGAGFIVALTGDVMTMPGLPKKPAALNMDVDENGNAIGLF